jgi:hypothetical protein
MAYNLERTTILRNGIQIINVVPFERGKVTILNSVFPKLYRIARPASFFIIPKLFQKQFKNINIIALIMQISILHKY